MRTNRIDALRLPAAKRDLVEAIVAALSRVPDLCVIALGGSHARGNNRPDSVDIGLYYRSASPFDIKLIRLGYNDVCGIVDITTGNKAVAPVAGIAAKKGFDEASGWGSIDMNQFVTSFISAAD
jgi:hypothetical protein